MDLLRVGTTRAPMVVQIYLALRPMEKFPAHGLLVPTEARRHNGFMLRCSVVSGWASVWLGLMALVTPARAAILWSDPGPTLVHENGAGTDILRSAVKRDTTSSDTLYFKFHVDPLSDVSSELYAAGFQLFEGDVERLGVGNSMKAWAYSAFNTEETGTNNQVPGDMDLRSASPESYHPGSFLEYELPRRGVGRTIVFKVQYVPGGDDLVTVWVHPNLVSGATEASQPESLTTHFKANASFDQIHLRHEGGGDGWTFSDMAIATSFNDFIVPHFWERRWFIALVVFLLLIWTATTIRLVERRRFQHQLQRATQERALERERARIAQDLHDDLGSSLTRISLLSSLLQADKDNPDQVDLSCRQAFRSPPTRPCARWRKSSGRCGPAAIRCRAWSNTSRTLRMRRSRTIPPVAGLTCRTICRQNRCRRMCGTTSFSSSRRR